MAKTAKEAVKPLSANEGEMEITISIDEARKFITYVNGLYGPSAYSGKAGVLKYIKRAGCIQFDPIDVCGKNPELVLVARVKGFQKQMLYELLYKDRALIDYYDKQLSIINDCDYKHFARKRDLFKSHYISKESVEAVFDEIKHFIKNNGPVCSQNLDMDEKVEWYWSETRLSRAALEAMYFTGQLGISHKSGTNKYYDLIDNCFDESIYKDDYMESDEAFFKWWLLRRITAVGMLRNKPSDAFLGMDNFKAPKRAEAFSDLIKENKITEITISGLKDKVYINTDDLGKLMEIKNGITLKKRCEFIAPLDNMMWDRRLIEDIFGFSYKWEIYTPKEQRKYGYYVLPVLYGYNFAGRIEIVRNKEKMGVEIINFWPEGGFKVTKPFEKALLSTSSKLAKFNGMEFLGKLEI